MYCTTCKRELPNECFKGKKQAINTVCKECYKKNHRRSQFYASTLPPYKLSTDEQEITDRVCKHFGVSFKDIQEKRLKELTVPRMIIAYIFRNKGYSYPEIAKIIRCNHTTIIYYKNAITDSQKILAKHLAVGEVSKVPTLKKHWDYHKGCIVYEEV